MTESCTITKPTFTVDSQTLRTALELCYQTIDSNPVLPIVGNYLFEFKPGVVVIKSTNLENSMITQIEAAGMGIFINDFSVAIPARILLDTVRALPRQPLKFTVNPDSFGVTLSCQTGRYKMAGLDGEDFPKIPTPENGVEFKLPSSELADAISETAWATSKDELRPAMTGILFVTRGDELLLVATDARALSRRTLVHEEDLEGLPKQMIIKGSVATKIEKLIANEHNDVSLCVTDSNLFVTYQHGQFITRLIDARYPDYQAVIPADNHIEAKFNRSDLIQILKRISIFSDAVTRCVIFDFKKDTTEISSQDYRSAQDCKEQINCLATTPLRIGFNVQLLIKALVNISGDEVTFKMDTPNRAIIVTSEASLHTSDLALVMPVMIDEI